MHKKIILLENISNNFDIKRACNCQKSKKKLLFISSIIKQDMQVNLFINWYKLINKDKFEPWLIDTRSIQDDHYTS